MAQIQRLRGTRFEGMGFALSIGGENANSLS
jgi:hypothetical protein